MAAVVAQVATLAKKAIVYANTFNKVLLTLFVTPFTLVLSAGNKGFATFIQKTLVPRQSDKENDDT